MKESTRKALDEAAVHLNEQFGESINDDGWKFHSSKRFIGITTQDNLVLVDLDLGGKVAAFYFPATGAKPLKATGEKGKKKKADAKIERSKRKAKDEDDEDEE